jgi:ATP-dependent DNA helicase UvrD/PcrA
LRFFTDLQLHSHYAMATSGNMDLEHMASGAKAKGLHLLGTGDFTHPKWFAELRAKLEPVDGTGLFHYGGITWMLAGEVSTIYEQGGKVRKVHHLLYASDFESVSRLIDGLGAYGNLASDGRPVLTGIDSAGLVELATGVSGDIVVVPAHVWTPWFGALGSKGGFDSIQECYEDQTKKIFAIETGLSSDPPMNWRLRRLDGFSLVSNSDAHSPNPWRLGREANVLELGRLTYRDVFGAIRSRDRSKFLFTVEVDPAYGKYHFTGHRKCGVSLSPPDAMAAGNICPRCGKKLTVGVLQRIEGLADRAEGEAPPGAVPFRSLLPLYEVISSARGVNRLYAKKVLAEQDSLIAAFGSEFEVLLGAEREELLRHTSERVADAILSVREGRLHVRPGYDGEYGVPDFG